MALVKLPSSFPLALQPWWGRGGGCCLWFSLVVCLFFFFFFFFKFWNQSCGFWQMILVPFPHLSLVWSLFPIAFYPKHHPHRLGTRSPSLPVSLPKSL